MRFLILVLMVFSFNVFASKPPVCLSNGSKSDGWYFKDTIVVYDTGENAYEDCSSQYVICAGIGSRSEGWYSVKQAEMKLVKQVACKEVSSVPICSLIGSRSEGWYNEKGLFGFDNCAGKAMKCVDDGLLIQGLYVVSGDVENKKLLVRDNCDFY